MLGRTWGRRATVRLGAFVGAEGALDGDAPFLPERGVGRGAVGRAAHVGNQFDQGGAAPALLVAGQEAGGGAEGALLGERLAGGAHIGDPGFPQGRVYGQVVAQELQQVEQGVDIGRAGALPDRFEKVDQRLIGLPRR